jgi:hypothetical protein
MVRLWKTALSNTLRDYGKALVKDVSLRKERIDTISSIQTLYNFVINRCRKNDPSSSSRIAWVVWWRSKHFLYTEASTNYISRLSCLRLLLSHLWEYLISDPILQVGPKSSRISQISFENPLTKSLPFSSQDPKLLAIYSRNSILYWNR